MNKVPEVLFGLLICMAIVLVSFFLISDAPEDQGFEHPNYPKNTMQQAPDGSERGGWVTISASCFGVLTCLFVVGGLSLGLSPRQVGFAPWILTIAAVIFASLFMLVVFLYVGVDNSAARLWGMPLSTAMMLLVLTPSPLVLVLLYMVAFPRWILPPEEKTRFDNLVANRRARQQ
ncbi:MAG: hypothetical protein MK171_10635 [Pirellulales bacterium]|nr:hypothetical protein [Pirellulales bacterium]